MGSVTMRYQSLINLGIALVIMLILSWYLNRTRAGTAILAVAQDRDAAQLMGVPVERIFLLVMVIAGVIAAASGVLLTAGHPDVALCRPRALAQGLHHLRHRRAR